MWCEFILKTYPVPTNKVTGGLAFYAAHQFNVSENASWNAFAEAVSLIPQIMDSGLTGTMMGLTKEAMALMGLEQTVSGVACSISLIGYNMTTHAMNITISNLVSHLKKITPSNSMNFTLTAPTSENFWTPASASTRPGGASLFTSRLLGRRELSEIPKTDLMLFLQQILVPQGSTGGMLLFGLQAGLGPVRVPEDMRGSVLPAWREAYAHAMAYGASINATGDVSEGLKQSAQYYEAVVEPV